MADPFQKSALVICDVPEVLEKIQEQIQPLFTKKMVVAANGKEAMKKTEFQRFDAVFLHTKERTLLSDQSVFKVTQPKLGQDQTKVPWIILASSVESPDIYAKYQGIIRAVDENWTADSLMPLLNNLFLDRRAASKALVDVNFINPFISALVDVILSMAEVSIKAGKPSMRKHTDPPTTRGDISGILSIQSDRFEGSIALTFQKQLALKIYSSMLGEDKESIDDDVKDCIMEITNIFFGNAKRDLNKQGHSIEPSIPSVITGENHEVRPSVEGVVLSIPFGSDFGAVNFECVISVKSS